MRLILSSIVLAALATNPSFAKDSHAQHGARASAANTAASRKATTGANPGKANAPIEAGAEIAPPVLPPHGTNQTQHQVRTISQSAKNPVNPPHGQGAITTNAVPVVRNAIGQPIVASKGFVAPQPSVSPAPRTPGIVSPPIVPPGAAHRNVASVPTRGSINGATVARPTIAPSAIGGPAQPRYGINGTTVQNKH